MHACQHGRTEVVRWFLDHGVRPDVAPYLGRTGLHWAIPCGHLEVIRLLLERGADRPSTTRPNDGRGSARQGPPTIRRPYRPRACSRFDWWGPESQS